VLLYIKFGDPMSNSFQVIGKVSICDGGGSGNDSDSNRGNATLLV
jgi:hypothetical protein